MTTATDSITAINIPNDTYAELLATLETATGHTQARADLQTAMVAAKNYKSRARVVILDAHTAVALREVARQATNSDNERKITAMNDKLDTAFPEGDVAVLDGPDATDVVEQTDAPTTDLTDVQPTSEVTDDGAPNTEAVEEAPKAEKAPKVKAEPKEKPAPTLLSRIRVLEDGGVPNVVGDAELSTLLRSTTVPSLESYEAQPAGGVVRYRSKSRLTGTQSSVVDLAQIKIPNTDSLGTTVAVVCEPHGVLLPLSNVRAGKRYIRRPGLFCATCAKLDAPVKAVAEPKPPKEPKAPREPRAKAEPKAPRLPKKTKIIEAAPTAEAQTDTASEPVAAVIHPADERADPETWNQFAAAKANETGAQVIWSADRQYALAYGEGKSIDVLVNVSGIEYSWRVETTTYDSLEAARAALGV